MIFSQLLNWKVILQPSVKGCDPLIRFRKKRLESTCCTSRHSQHLCNRAHAATAKDGPRGNGRQTRGRSDVVAVDKSSHRSATHGDRSVVEQFHQLLLIEIAKFRRTTEVRVCLAKPACLVPSTSCSTGRRCDIELPRNVCLRSLYGATQ